MKLNHLFAILLCFVSTPVVASDAAKEIHWWEIATGVLAIPAAVIGIIFTYASIRKIKLESDKIELEIREKQRLVAISDVNTSEARELAKTIFNPLIDNNRVNYFVLRFVVIFLLIAFWGVVESAWGFLIGSAYFTLNKGFGFGMSTIMEVALFTMSQIIKFGNIAIVLIFGVPLYRDIANHIGFNIMKKGVKNPTV